MRYGKINFPTKIDRKIRLTLETDMKKLFQSHKNRMGNSKFGKTADSTNPNDYEPDAIPATPDVQIVLLKASMIQYEQLTLDTNFRQYLETILFSAKVLRMRVQRHHTKKLPNYRQTLKILRLTFKEQTDNLTG